MLREIVVPVLLVSGVTLELACCLGVVVMRGPYDRLHYAGAASFGAVLIAAAVLAQEGFSLVGNKALLLAAFLLVSSPVLVHATGRAARIRERGDLRLAPSEEEERR